MSEPTPVITKSCRQEVVVFGIITILSLIYFILVNIEIYLARGWSEWSCFGIPCKIFSVRVLDYTIGRLYYWETILYLNSLSYNIVQYCQSRVMMWFSTAITALSTAFWICCQYNFLWLEFDSHLSKSSSWSLNCPCRASLPMVFIVVPLRMTKSFKLSSNRLNCFSFWPFFFCVEIFLIK